jgi:hypothetical protein
VKGCTALDLLALVGAGGDLGWDGHADVELAVTKLQVLIINV